MIMLKKITEENYNGEDTSKLQLIEQLCELLKLKCIVYTSYKQPEIYYGFYYVLALLRKRWQCIDEAMNSGYD